MDSDSSLESEESHGAQKGRSWENRQNSDVSDDENFSRGAKSIDSPPESPPRGGGNLDSPPASPAQGIESPPPPQSPDSQSRSGSQSQTSTPSRSSPMPPDSPPPDSPQSAASLPDERFPRSPANTSPRPPVDSPQNNFDSAPPSPKSAETPPFNFDSAPPSPKSAETPPSNFDSAPPSPKPPERCQSIESLESYPDSPRSPGYPRSPDKGSRSSSPDSHASSRSGNRRNDDGPASPEPTEDKDAHSDDGRSNISSNSTLGSVPSHRSAHKDKFREEKKEKVIKSHAEDLSDVSDIESLGPVSDDEGPSKAEEKKEEQLRAEKDKPITINEENEQLDFEAEEEKEDGECDGPPNPPASASNAANSAPGSSKSEEGEEKELEEGELSDEGENRPEETEPRPVCRFFSRGQCTWGSSCRFVHPGVTDKGNYTMFDMVRPLVPMNSGPPPPHMYGPMDVYGPRPLERPIVAPMRREEPPGESAWERGLRQAKEMLRRSSKRKETEPDFEEKKMNLSLGQDELDKENDYYTGPTSPIFTDDMYHDRYMSKTENKKHYRDRGYPPEYAHGYYPPHPREHWGYDDRRYHPGRHHQGYPPRGGSVAGGGEDYYDRKRHRYGSREVILQRAEKGVYKDGSSSRRHNERGSGSGRGDEWADPWMRSKSPSRKGGASTSSRPRKKSYSSRSSYSSSSSSRSSSYSSYSRSRSRSRSSGSNSSKSRSRSPPRKKTSPIPRRSVKSPFSRDRRVDAERSLHMNPPPPSPRGNPSPVLRRNPTPPSPDRAGRNLSARLIASELRNRSPSRSSGSSSDSDSSGSSSDSSSDSGSSSSSSRGATPPPRAPPKPASSKSTSNGRRKMEIDEKLALAQAMKVKAMDALKVSGQKQQIKLTLKGNSATERLVPQVPSSRKRPADSPPFDADDLGSSKSKKPAPSRREELLKQLKAVEDAIARKRSKI